MTASDLRMSVSGAGITAGGCARSSVVRRAVAARFSVTRRPVKNSRLNTAGGLLCRPDCLRQSHTEDDEAEVIHGDANDHNLVVSPEGEARVGNVY